MIWVPVSVITIVKSSFDVGIPLPSFETSLEGSTANDRVELYNLANQGKQNYDISPSK